MAAFAFAAAILSGCTASLPTGTSSLATPTAAFSSPATAINSLEDLRDAAVAAGYSCPNWQQDDAMNGACSGQDAFLFFETASDREESHSRLASHVKNGLVDAVLFGDMWAINGVPKALGRVRPVLGGELLLNPAYKPATDPKKGDSCTSAKGNASSGDLLKASVKLSGRNLTATFEFADKPPTRSAESFGVFLLGANYAAGTGSYQAGATWEGGKTQGPFIMNLDSATQQNYPATDITMSGKTISVAFDSEPFEKLGSGWQWRAAVSLDGQDTDSCPGGVEDFLVYR